jgi:hypothetical protein
MLELIFVAPLILIIYLFSRSRNKDRRWLSVFNSQHDFINNVLSIFASIVVGQIIWQIFDIFLFRNYSGTTGRWVSELIVLSIIISGALIGYFTKAFHLLATSVFNILFFFFYLLGSWSSLEGNSDQSTQPIIAIITGVFATFSLYIITKIIQKNEYILRFTTYLQFILIGLIYAGLATFSSYYFPANLLFTGKSLDIQHWALGIAFGISILTFFGLIFYVLGKKIINLFEFTGVIVTAVLPLILLGTGAGKSIENNYSYNYTPTLQSVLYISLSSVLFLLWPIFIIRRGEGEGVKWKRNYGVLLLIFGIIAKIIELSTAGLLQSGFVFVLVGGLLIGTAIFLQLRTKKSQSV